MDPDTSPITGSSNQSGVTEGTEAKNAQFTQYSFTLHVTYIMPCLLIDDSNGLEKQELMTNSPNIIENG